MIVFRTSPLRTSSARVFRELRVHMRSRHAAEQYVGAPNTAQRPDLAPGAHYVHRRESAEPGVNIERRTLVFENQNLQLNPKRPASRRSMYTARRAHRRHPQRPVFGMPPYVRRPAFIRPCRLPCLGSSKATVRQGDSTVGTTFLVRHHGAARWCGRAEGVPQDSHPHILRRRMRV